MHRLVLRSATSRESAPPTHRAHAPRFDGTVATTPATRMRQCAWYGRGPHLVAPRTRRPAWSTVDTLRTKPGMSTVTPQAAPAVGAADQKNLTAHGAQRLCTDPQQAALRIGRSATPSAKMASSPATAGTTISAPWRAAVGRAPPGQRRPRHRWHQPRRWCADPPGSTGAASATHRRCAAGHVARQRPPGGAAADRQVYSRRRQNSHRGPCASSAAESGGKEQKK